MTISRPIVLFLALSPMLAQETPSSAEPSYSGPAILSRGGAASNAAAAPLTFRPYINISGIYDTGIIGTTTNSLGQIVTHTAPGVELDAGVYGSHQWRHTYLKANYRGDYRHYSGLSYYDGTDQALDLTLTHQLSRRFTFTLESLTGMYSRQLAFESLGGYVNTGLLGLPVNDLFDNQVVYGTVMGGITYQKSARLSFNFSGEGFLTRRRSSALYGNTGYAATANMVYRLSRYTSVGVSYGFEHFEFVGAFGASDIHMASADFGFRLSRSLEFSARGGAQRLETLFIRSVPIDPVIAAITGQTVGILASYSVGYSPLIGGRLTYTPNRTSTLSLNYDRSISTGNGILVSTRQEVAMGNYTYLGLRHWSFNASGGYNKNSGSLSFENTTYTTYVAGLGFTRDLARNLHVICRLDARKYNLQGIKDFNHPQYRAMLGFSWSPGDIPLALW